MPSWLLALLLAITTSTLAWRLRALNPSGAVAATALGTLVVTAGGWWLGVTLVFFFVSSSLIGRLTGADSLDQARGSRRDWVQVLANGGGAAIGAVLFALSGWQPWLLAAIGASAAATADTWSSEIGQTSPTRPRLLTNLQTVPPGTSGAVSSRGFFASLAGAMFIALLAAIDPMDTLESISTGAVLAGVTLAGFGGGLLDSLLGATVQEQRWCSSCKQVTERNPHRCGNPTSHASGIAGFNNDVVNACCIGFGALSGIVSGIL